MCCQERTDKGRSLAIDGWYTLAVIGSLVHFGRYPPCTLGVSLLYIVARKVTDLNSHLRQRSLLTVDEVITPQSGNCSIFARYVEPNFATQVILTARLTRLYERRDWRERVATAKNVESLLLERGIALDLKPFVPQLEPAATAKPGTDREMLERAHQRVMAQLEQKTPGKTPLTDLAQMRQARQARLSEMEHD